MAVPNALGRAQPSLGRARCGVSAHQDGSNGAGADRRQVVQVVLIKHCIVLIELFWGCTGVAEGSLSHRLGTAWAFPF